MHPSNDPKVSCQNGELADLLSAVRKTPETRIRQLFATLEHLWGPQNWWPADTPFEVIAGAILVQNTAWTNAAKAIQALREAGALSLEGIRQTPLPEIERLVRSSGFFRQKAARLKAFVEWLDRGYGGSLETMFRQDTAKLRSELLAIKGIGHETADSILLYAGHHEIFVVDAYARRVFERHGLIAPNASYDEVRQVVERSLDQGSPELPRGLEPARVLPMHDPSPMSEAPRTPRAQVFNEMHAVLVQIGKHYCHRARAVCEECPLKYDLPQTA